ncbi:hypothetical protein APHAL10511_003351 [Amanita phalloides]|nr:hypothetical protein APHAL10511_003351 [Amanita phalloides]
MPTIPLGLDTSPSSPYFSPASATSSLYTPTDLSPPRPFDVKLQGAFEMRHVHTAPYRSQFSQSSACLPTSNSLQPLDPFSEPPTPPPVASQYTFNALPNSIAQSWYSLSPSCRVESRRPSLMNGRLASQLQQHQPLTQAQDWIISSDKATSDNLEDFNHDDQSLHLHQHSRGK